jgi:glycosyltransferase involved in cell wall biosynthesis
MKIVACNDFGHAQGGASQVALQSAAELARQGHEVTALVAVAPVDPTLEEAGVRVVCTNQQEILRDPVRARAAFQGVWNFPAATAMERVLERCSPSDTVVHLHGWTKALSSSVVHVAARRGFRVVCTMHDYFLACCNGGFFNYPAGRICTEVPLSRRCVLANCDVRGRAHKAWRVVRQVAQVRLGGLPGAVRDFIAVSDFSLDVMRPWLPAGAHVHRVDYPIDVERGPCATAGENRAVVFLGRLSPEKGPTLLARAARALSLPVTFLGDGAQRDEVLRLAPHARVTGWLDRADVARELRQARVLVVPSLVYETLGMAALEAAAVGVPAVVPDSSAARECVEDGVTGLWFRGRSETDLGRALQLLADDARVAKLGQAAYDRFWRRPPTLELHVTRLTEVYRTILAR